MKYIRVFICIVIIFSITINITSIFAAEVRDSEVGGGGVDNGGFLESIFNSGRSFFGGGSDIGGLGATISNMIKTQVIPIIVTIGNLIFYIVAAFLGVRYIWSSVEGKANVKESLPTFVVAASVFYLANTIFNFFVGADFKGGILGTILAGGSFETVTGNLWSNIALIVNILAIAGIAALGLKYMFAEANTKADIKKDMIPVVIGLVLIYSITNVLNFLVTAGGQIIQ
jgi:hypothetical protein